MSEVDNGLAPEGLKRRADLADIWDARRRFRASALDDLERAVEGCVRLSQTEVVDLTQIFHEITASQFRILAAILACERAGHPRERILSTVAPIRALGARSPLMRRMQTWPRGYPGDFETIEAMCDAGNRVPPSDLMSFVFQEFALRCAPVQQHRNKVHEQARLLVETFRTEAEPRVLSIASGPSHDVRSVVHALGDRGRLVLNDADPDALCFAATHLGSIASICEYVPGNVFRVYKKLAARGPYDLVLAGGLFDYLNDRLAEHLVQIVATHLVKPGGRFFFTNIARGNPYRTLMEYLVDWPLIERDAKDLERLCHAAGVVAEHVKISKDAMDLALMVEVRKARV
jgi:SAM-dependent methyltransferase